jgi:hypothetical protein
MDEIDQQGAAASAANDGAMDGSDGHGDGQGDSGEQDPIKNVKSEFNRKFDDVTSQIQRQNQEMSAAMNAILETLSTKQQAAPAQEENMADLAITDPAKYAQIIENRATQRAMQAVTQVTQQQQQNTQVIAEYASKFPEFSDSNSELAKTAIAEYQKLSPKLKDTREGTEMALLKAVQMTGAIPMDKRKKQEANEDFTTSASTGQSTQRRQQQREPDLDPKTIGFAEQLGVNVKDPEVLKRLKKYAGRKNWNKFGAE